MKNIVFLTGSGISKESGIPTFRDCGDGLWNNFPVDDIASIEGYRKNREKVINFYNDLRRQFKDCKPNKAHYLIAELEKNPEYNVTVITQNVDNLHEQAGSTNVIHLHGEADKATSSQNPNDEKCIVELHGRDIKIGEKAADGSQLRPFIVWFGEPVPNIIKTKDIVNKADILIVVGTSLQVYPAADLIYEIPWGHQVYNINPNMEVVNDEQFMDCPIKHIQKVATEGMQEMFDILNNK